MSEQAKTPLPEGWEEHHNEAAGRSYFHNLATGESTWYRPVAEPTATATLATNSPTTHAAGSKRPAEQTLSNGAAHATTTGLTGGKRTRTSSPDATTQEASTIAGGDSDTAAIADENTSAQNGGGKAISDGKEADNVPSLDSIRHLLSMPDSIMDVNVGKLIKQWLQNVAPKVVAESVAFHKNNPSSSSGIANNKTSNGAIPGANNSTQNGRMAAVVQMDDDDDDDDDDGEELTEAQMDAVHDKARAKHLVASQAAAANNRQFKLSKRVDSSTQGSINEMMCLLANSYVGLGEMCNLVTDWLMTIPASSRKNDFEIGGDDDGLDPTEVFIMNHLKATIVATFKREAINDVVLEEGVPEWLKKMLRYKIWRHMLVVLAGKSKVGEDKAEDVPLLDFAINAISDAGFHDEVAQVPQSASFFTVFRSALGDLMSNVAAFDPHVSEQTLHKFLEDLKMYTHKSQSTLLFTLEILAQLEESPALGSPDEQIDAAVAAARDVAKLSSATAVSSSSAVSSSAPTGANADADAGKTKLLLPPGLRLVIRRLRQELLTFAASTQSTDPVLERERKETVALVHPMHRPIGIDRLGLNSSAGAGGGVPQDIIDTINDVLKDNFFTAEALAKLRAYFDPVLALEQQRQAKAENKEASPPPALWFLRQECVLRLLTNQLFHPYKANISSQREDGGYLLAVAAAYNPNDVEASLQRVAKLNDALLQAQQICNNEATTSATELDGRSPNMRLLASLMPTNATVSQSVLIWVMGLIMSSKFNASHAMISGLPTLLHLNRIAAKCHPLQRHYARFLVWHVFEFLTNTQVISAQLPALRRAVMNELVYLMEVGEALPVLKKMIVVTTATVPLEFSLLRHFIERLVRTVGAPLSQSFAKVALQFINLGNCTKAISSNQKLQAQVETFRILCMSEIQKSHVHSAQQRRYELLLKKAQEPPSPVASSSSASASSTAVRGSVTAASAGPSAPVTNGLPSDQAVGAVGTTTPASAYALPPTIPNAPAALNGTGSVARAGAGSTPPGLPREMIRLVPFRPNP